MTPVIGVDGCPGGWIAVRWAEGLSHHLCRSFSDVLALDAAIIAVDMPVGLPEMSGRAAEREVRSKLGDRQSSVFSIPSRAAASHAPQNNPNNGPECTSHRRNPASSKK